MAFGIFASFRGYVLASVLLTTAVFSHAIYMKRLFYRSVIFLSKSRFAILAVGNMALVTILLVWRLIQSVFLGQLRFREIERLHIRARDAIIECCFAMTIFREEFDLKFVALVTTLLLLKSLHWLTKDRIEFLEERPLSPLRAHLRLVGLMALLFLLDALLVFECVGTTYRAKAPTMFVLFAFEFTVLIIELCSDFVRYVFHAIDLYLEGRWESKGLYSFYNELLSDMCQLTVYILFFIYVQVNYTFPIHIIRELYMTFHKFQRRCTDFVRYRRVVATMNDLFADATEEELAEGDRTCIICREEMTAAKKLSCDHMFHARCLQSWLKRQLTCPTCRATVDVNGNESQGDARGARNGEQNPQQANGADNPVDNDNNNAADAQHVPNNAGGAQREPPVNQPNAGQGVANNGIPNEHVHVGEADGRLINYANQWWDQVMNGAEAGAQNAGAADQQPNARPLPNANADANWHMHLHGPNAAAHMQLRARRRGAWPQPYQPYHLPQQQHHHYHYPNQQAPARPLLQQRHQNLRQVPLPAAPEQPQGAHQAGPNLNPQPQASTSSRADNVGQGRGASASTMGREPPRSEEIEQAAAAAIAQWQSLRQAALQRSSAAASSTDATRSHIDSNASNTGLEGTRSIFDVPGVLSDALAQRVDPPVQHQISDTNVADDGSERPSLPLGRLLAIQEQIEVLRGEVQDLVLLATNSPGEVLAPTEMASDRTNEQSTGTGATSETLALSSNAVNQDTDNSPGNIELEDSNGQDLTAQDVVDGGQQRPEDPGDQNAGGPTDDEAAEVRRRRIEFLEGGSNRRKS